MACLMGSVIWAKVVIMDDESDDELIAVVADEFLTGVIFTIIMGMNVLIGVTGLICMSSPGFEFSR